MDRLTRRRALGLAAAAVVAGCSRQGSSTTTWGEPHAVGSGSPTAMPTSVPTTMPGATPSATPPPETGLQADVTAFLRRFLVPSKENPKHPTYAGAVALAQVDGKVIVHSTVGDAVRYKAGPVELPPAQRVPMRPDSIFDQASVTKVYAAILVLQLADEGRIDLAAPVVDYLPEFDGPGKAAITVTMLLAHTGGLPVGVNISGLSTVEQRWAASIATPLLSGATPGDTFRYSSTGLMVLGKIVEKLTGQRLDQALRTRLTGPLGLRDTGFTPTTWMSSAQRDRIAATDARTSRGLLRGVVHDDVCNKLGGVAAHAGLFSSAPDLAVIGQMLLNRGQVNGVRILSESMTERMVTNVNQGLPAIDPDRPGRPSDHGLGVTINQPWLMGKLASPDAFGHTGFAGTSLVVCRRRKLVLVLLTNRAHPNWSWANPDPVRAQLATLFA